MSASTKATTTNASGGPTLTSFEVIDAIDGTIVKALEAGDLNMYDSEVHDVTENGFQVSVSWMVGVSFLQPTRHSSTKYVFAQPSTRSKQQECQHRTSLQIMILPN